MAERLTPEQMTDVEQMRACPFCSASLVFDQGGPSRLWECAVCECLVIEDHPGPGYAEDDGG